MKKAPYTPCKLYVDGFPDLEVGDYITTSGGSAYLVQAMRISKTRMDRKHLQCLRWPIAEIPPDANQFELFWYSRSKRRAA